MVYNRRKIGSEYEKAAGEYLKQQGYEILEYNYRCKTGEMDIIARDGEYLVFCEVKYRKDTGKGHPSEAVDARKQRVISRCAQYYLMIKGKEYIPCRFDVVSIMDGEIMLFKDAFDWTAS